MNANNSRREFLKKASIGSLLLTAPLYSWGANRPKGKNQKMGIALVGLGYYSRDLLAPALQETEETYLSGIVTGSLEKARNWAEKYSIPEKNIYNYDNFDEIANNKDIDIVYIVLPNSLHKEYTIRAAKAGKHVICEKPMALNAAECRDMIKACADNKVSLSIGYRMQFEPHTKEIIRLGQEKIMGQVKLVTAAAGFTYSSSMANNWRTIKAMGGGAMMDMGVYSLNAARYVTGMEPLRVTAQSFVMRPELFKEVDEITTFQLEFPGSTIANLSTSFHTGCNYLRANAEKGWFALSPFQSYGGIQGDSSQGKIEFPQINQQAAQMDEVAVCIREKKPMRVPGEEGLMDMIVVDAINESISKNGATIQL